MISVCVTWPTSFDYPIFRKHLPELRDYVDEVVVCFTVHGEYPLFNWVKDSVNSDVVWTSSLVTQYGGDWRNEATHRLIKESKHDWLLFLEQDFFIKDFSTFFKKISTAMATHDVVSFLEGDRFHPAFFLVRREKLLKTSCDFSATNGFDHFGRVSQELKKYNCITLPELGLFQDKDWVHLRGLTDNYFAPKPYFNLPEFKAYNKACMEVTPMSEYWMGEMKRCDEI